MSDGWVKTDQGWVKRYGPARAQATARADLPCPMVISDTMPDTEHVDGKHYTSKSAFRATTKAGGFVEVGNDPARMRPPPAPKSDPAGVRAAIERARAQHT